MKLLPLLLLFSLVSCLSKGSKDVSGESAPQDITISLLRVSPPSIVIGPSENTEFTAIGGNPPYTYRVSSGYGSVTDEGVYYAPSSVGNNTIEVKDAGGNTVYAVVTIGSSLQLSPATKTIGTNESFTLSSLGGVPPYTYSIISGGGSINSSSGEYTSGGSHETVSVQVEDSNNNRAYSTVTVVDSLTAVPATITIEDNDNYAFSVVGGAAPYSYQVYAGSGVIDSNGNYTAPPGAGVEIIRVTDSNSNYVEATVTVAKGPDLSVTDSNVAPGQVVTFSSSEGTGPFVYTVESGSGSINATTGVFTAPAIADLTTVRVTDANGFIDEMNIQTYNLKKLVLGDTHTCMLHIQNDNTTSEFKCWGTLENGLAGNSNSYIGDAPGEMGNALATLNFGSGNTPIAIYSSQYYHRCALFSNGKSKCWGYGNQGRTGTASQTDRGEYAGTMGSALPFIQIGDAVTIDTVLDADKRISVGSEHSCVIIDTDSVKCFGNGAQGRSGYGDETDRCANSATCNNNLTELNLGAGKSIVKLVAGHEHSCAILAPDNKIKCWGDAGHGRLGNGGTTDQIITPNAASWVELGTGRTAKDLALGYHHSCALLDNDTIKCWGRNNYGQLGQGTNQDQGDQIGEMGDALAVSDMGSTSYPVSIHAKGYHSCAVFNNGDLKCWGRNNFGQLGQGNTATRGDGGTEMGDNLAFTDLGAGETVSHIDLSERTTCVVTNLGNVKCWGDNSLGQLGIENTDTIGNNGSEMGAALASVDLGSGRTATQVSTSLYSTCALLDNSTVKCWGADQFGNLGIESNGFGDESGETVANLSNIDLGTGVYAKDIFGGRYHVCAVLTDNTTKCFGNGGNGRLGQENGATRGDNPNEMGDNLAVTNLGAGLYPISGDGWTNHSCAILSNGQIKCWGEGGQGRTGHGGQADRGDGAGEMGDNLIFTDMGAGRSAKVVETGDNFSCAILDNDGVKCWGDGAQGRRGSGNTADRGDGGSEMGDNLAYVNLGTGRTAKDIKLGHQHACVLMDNNQVKCWGEGSYGRLGIGNQADIGNAGSETGDGIAQTDLGTGRSVKAIATGIYHSCALLDNNKINCWGYNGYGQLGRGTNANIGDGAGEMGDNMVSVMLPNADKPVSIYAGGYHTCTVLESNEIKCWGRNQAGQLGHEHRYNVGIDALSMNRNLPVTY